MDSSHQHFILLLAPSGEPRRVIAGPFDGKPSDRLLGLCHQLCWSRATEDYLIQTASITPARLDSSDKRLRLFLETPAVLESLGVTLMDAPFVCRVGEA